LTPSGKNRTPPPRASVTRNCININKNKMDTVYLTRDGLEKLRKELERLVKVVRPEATVQLTVARAHGDLSENAEYDAAKDNLATIDRKIGDLQTQLSRVQILEESDLSDGEVRILSVVTLLELGKNREVRYTLVDPLQADPMQNLISVKSPIGKGLLGKKVGEEASITIPSGEIRFRVVAIERSKGL